jgi:hypothetical protein
MRRDNYECLNETGSPWPLHVDARTQMIVTSKHTIANIDEIDNKLLRPRLTGLFVEQISNLERAVAED